MATPVMAPPDRMWLITSTADRRVAIAFCVCVHKKAACCCCCCCCCWALTDQFGGKDNRRSIHQSSIVFGGHCITLRAHHGRSCTAVAAIPTSIWPTFYKIVFTRKNGPLVVHTAPTLQRKLRKRFRERPETPYFHQQLNHRPLLPNTSPKAASSCVRSGV